MIKMVSSLPLDSAWSCVMAAETQDSITKKHYDLGLRDTDSATALVRECQAYYSSNFIHRRQLKELLLSKYHVC